MDNYVRKHSNTFKQNLVQNYTTTHQKLNQSLDYENFIKINDWKNATPTQKIKIIQELQKYYRLPIILKSLKVARRTYYNWLNYQKPQRKLIDEKIKPLLKRAWLDNLCVYGAPRLQICLARQGYHLGLRRIKRLMNELGIHSLMNKKFESTKIQHDYQQNLRIQYCPKRLNLIKDHKSQSIWRTDITYLPIDNHSGLYLSTVFDNQTAKILAKKLSCKITTDLAIATLLKALANNPKPEFLHSDLGEQYLNSKFEKILIQYGIIHSYSAKGHPYDNGPIEAFYSILKREFIFHHHFHSRQELVARTNKYIDWYNTKRIRVATK